jgi:hypothetical protein
MSIDEDKGERAQLAREVVELGEELFELALRGYSNPENVEARKDADVNATVVASVETAGEQGYPVEELREAADEFFRVLRRLLDVEKT